MGGEDSIDLAENRDRGRAVVNVVMKLWVSRNAEKFLTS